MARRSGRVGKARALAVLGLCLTAALAAVPARAAAGTVFYSTANIYFSGKLWSVRDDGSHRRLLRGKLFTGPSGVEATLSRDGKRILCLCRRGEVDSIKLDGSEMRQIGVRPRGTRYDVVVLGAGGETLWFEDRHDRVMTQGVDGSHPHALVRGNQNRFVEEEFAISPDGRKLAFVVGNCVTTCAAGGEEVWIAPTGGGPKKLAAKIPGEREIDQLQWSQDSRSLTFVNYPIEEKYEIPEDPNDHFILYSGGHAREVQIAPPAAAGQAFFSPAGSLMALPGEVPGTLYTVSLDGQVHQRLLGELCGEVRCLFGPTAFGWLHR
jgi:WD40-like Beta Propeller Repeat